MASFTSNNHFAALSGLKTPLGKFVLERVSSGDKATATGSNAIPVASGNNKYTAALKSKLLPNLWETSASHPGPSSPRKTSKLLPQAKSYIPPSKRAISLPLPKVAEASPSNWKDKFPKLIPCEFLWSLQDHKMNSGSSKSYSHVATKGIKTGSKQSFRSKESLLPSWSETWMTPKDWLSLLPNEKNVSPT